MELARPLDLLRAALTEAGIPLWEPPESPRDLEDLEAELASARLPAALREFWALVDVATLRVAPYPAFITPAMALTFWRQSRDEFPDTQPLALVTVGYARHLCMEIRDQLVVIRETLDSLEA